jgi:hypothetical protein
MEELEVIKDGSNFKPAVNPGEAMSDEQLDQAIADTMSKLSQPPVEDKVEEVKEAPQEPVVEDKPIEQEKTEPKQEPEPKIEPVAEKTEDKKDDKVTFEKVQQKAGFKTPDDLANSYDHLVKKMHAQAQEISALKKPQQTYQPGADLPANPPSDPEEARRVANEWFQNNVEKDPVGTIAKLNDALMRPIREQNRDIVFKNEIMRLSSHPSTADFNTPEVQEEMQKVIAEKPHRYLDAFGKVDPSCLEDAYYVAKGRVVKVVAQNVAQPKINKPVPVEGGNKNPIQKQKAFNPHTASEEELDAEIRRLQKEVQA